MNTREDNVAAAMREAQEIAEQQALRRRAHKWVWEWYDGDEKCPRCAGREFDLFDRNSDDGIRYETFQCKTDTCGTRWKVAFRETALLILHDDADGEEDWIDLPIFDEPFGTRVTDDPSHGGEQP